MATTQIKIQIKVDHVSVKQLKKTRKLLIKLLDRRSRFEKFYDSVSNFLSGGKSFLPKDIKAY